MYYIYIIKCEGGELYTGITSDISRRMTEHFTQSKRCAKYTRTHKAVSLEALWTAESRSLASKLEWRIKQLDRRRKLELIEAPDKICGEASGFTAVTDYSLEEILQKNRQSPQGL